LSRSERDVLEVLQTEIREMEQELRTIDQRIAHATGEALAADDARTRAVAEYERAREANEHILQKSEDEKHENPAALEDVSPGLPWLVIVSPYAFWFLLSWLGSCR
jgi:hypothetical protein